MPLYEYLCESCGERTEMLRRFGDSTEVVCPSCGAAMRKLPSAPAIQFKGSGFYQTDYKKSVSTEESKPKKKKEEKKADSASPTTPPDSKPPADNKPPSTKKE